MTGLSCYIERGRKTKSVIVLCIQYNTYTTHMFITYPNGPYSGKFNIVYLKWSALENG